MAENLDEDAPKYIEGYLYKKEETWTQYWMVLCGTHLLIHHAKPKNNEILRDLLIGWIEINDETRCIMGKKKNYSFPFYILTKKGKYLLKTESTLVRHRWVTAIQLCSQGRSPQLIPKHLSQVKRYLGKSENIQLHNDEALSTEEADNVDNDDLGLEDIDINDDEHDGSAFCNQGNRHSCEIDVKLPSNVILVSSMCDNVSNFLCSTKTNVSEANTCDTEFGKNNLTKKVSYLYDEKPAQQSFLSPTISLGVKQSPNRLTKSADSLKQLKLLDTLRSNSDTNMRNREKGNMCSTHFSRHLVNFSQEDVDDNL